MSVLQRLGGDFRLVFTVHKGKRSVLHLRIRKTLVVAVDTGERCPKAINRWSLWHDSQSGRLGRRSYVLKKNEMLTE